MNVLVKYFNKRNGTIEAMNDYGPILELTTPKQGKRGWFQAWMILLFSVTGTHRPKPTWNGSSRPGTH